MRSLNGSNPAIDNSDWLKTAAIVFVVIDHAGYFFIEDAAWWSVFGRMASPVFFFLLGYAKSRTIPIHWLWLGFFLSLLDSWNNDWDWVAPNILFSLALIRASRPCVLRLLQKYGWAAFIFLVLVLLLVLPVAGEVVEYGAEGWFWALFGLCQRMYIDGKTLSGLDVSGQKHGKPEGVTQNWGMMRMLACPIAAVVYVWQEQLEFWFSGVQLVTVGLGIGLLSTGLYIFARGPSRLQPPEPVAGFLRFMGRHTLEIYAIQLAGSELIIGFLPDLSP